MRALHVGVRAEQQSVKPQRHTSLHRATERLRQKVRHLETFVVDVKAAATGKARGVKDRLVAQSDVLAGIAAGAAELPSRVSCFAADVGPARRCLRRTQILAKVQQIHPAPVAKAPFRVCKVVHFRLRIEVRTAGV